MSPPARISGGPNDFVGDGVSARDWRGTAERRPQGCNRGAVRHGPHRRDLCGGGRAGAGLSSARLAHAAPADRAQRQLLQRDRHPPQALRGECRDRAVGGAGFLARWQCSPGATSSTDELRTSTTSAMFVWSTPRIADDAIAKQLHDAGHRRPADRRLHGAAQSPLRHSRGRGCRPGALTTAGIQATGASKSIAMFERALNIFWILLGRSRGRLCMDARPCRSVRARERAVSLHRGADRDGRRRGSAVVVSVEAAAPDFPRGAALGRVLGVIAGLAFMAISIPYLGFAVAGFITMIILLRAVEKSGWVFSIALAFVSVVVVVWLFGHVSGHDVAPRPMGLVRYGSARRTSHRLQRHSDARKSLSLLSRKPDRNAGRRAPGRRSARGAGAAVADHVHDCPRSAGW